MDHLNEIVSSHHLLNLPPLGEQDQIAQVQLLERHLREDGRNSFILETREDRSSGCWELSFLGKFKSDLFSDLTGVIALHNINILSARILTWEDGSVVNILMKTEALRSDDPEDVWKEVIRDLQNRVTGKLALAPRLNLKVIPPAQSRYKEVPVNSDVIIDNESSESFTLIKIISRDRLGLLYQITHTLNDLRLTIRVARISTTLERVEDLFYVHGRQKDRGAGSDQRDKAGPFTTSQPGMTAGVYSRQ